MSQHQDTTRQLQSQSQGPTEGEWSPETSIAPLGGMSQFKIQEAANNSSQVQQLMGYQAAANASQQVSQLKSLQENANDTGLSDQLKSGVEGLSGMDMSDVKVHFNSDQPAQMHAHAFAQGTDIHVAPGQEQHLPHEAWHVAQQKQGRVQPTNSVNGSSVNDDPGLESEADTMGAKALQMKAAFPRQPQEGAAVQLNSDVAQCVDEFEDEGAATVYYRSLMENAEEHTSDLEELKKQAEAKGWDSLARRISIKLGKMEETALNRDIASDMGGTAMTTLGKSEEEKGLHVPMMPVKHGLIHGSYNWEENMADLHVSDKAGGPSKLPESMFLTLSYIYELMVATRFETGKSGTLMLRPGGASIVKLVAEMLGEALGGSFGKMKARFAQKKRKFTEGKDAKANRSKDKLDPLVLPEHFAYLDSMRGPTDKVKLSIAPLIPPNIEREHDRYDVSSREEFDQNMMETTPEGNARYETFKAHAADPAEGRSAGFLIHIGQDQLPQILALLKGLK